MDEIRIQDAMINHLESKLIHREILGWGWVLGCVRVLITLNLIILNIMIVEFLFV